ncbi:MAG: hypothetical protein IJ740_08290 [Ruminococcus sp.]|nr:hypothetical protein [Ruminococcus sp.]
MPRYVLINEYNVEISPRDYKKAGSIGGALIAEGVGNCSTEELGIFDNEQAALNELAKYTTTYRLTHGFAGVELYSCDVYYITEQDDDDGEWQDTGNFNLAIEKRF